MRRNFRKRTFEQVGQTKIEISLQIYAVWSESSLSAFWIVKSVKSLHSDNEDSDQTD